MKMPIQTIGFSQKLHRHFGLSQTKIQICSVSACQGSDFTSGLGLVLKFGLDLCLDSDPVREGEGLLL